ncbi:MAG TPA: glycoside hydrolase family 3 C-terminal domain-containing protein [Opitutaceae bacterium]|nr:glycoside hydrolase family 3 C-terminal domain-containing protein [Opitutaceae bacterium]
MKIPHRIVLGVSLIAAAVLVSPQFTRAAEKEDRPYLNPALPVEARIDDLIGRLTLDEKISLVHASGKFRAGGVPRLGIPYLWTADGPQGVREEVGVDSWEPAGRTDDFVTAMPVGMALAASWDPQLAEEYGKVVGEEARQRNKHVILGPAINIMRTPLCGRNYDYFGEDPWLTSRMTVGYVKGMQSEQTVACIKHFALNNQETERGTIDVEVDERTLREIYLPAFEAGVKEGGALSIMGAYNKFRGQHCCHNEYLLNDILKNEWGFKGSVISDWGGTHDARQAVLYGLDLEMGTGKPYDQYYLGAPFREMIEKGEVPMSVLDDKVRRNLRMLFAAGAVDGQRPAKLNTKAHLDIARRVAAEGIVLLKNDHGLLPLDPKKYTTIAVIGDNAVRKYAAGGNAAGVKAFHEITALEGITARAGRDANVVYSQGFRQPERRAHGQRDVAGVRTSDLTGASPEEEKTLAERAVRAAKEADVVVFVGGLTHQARADDEGVDRVDLSLPAHQDELIGKIVAANPRTVVVLISGSPVTMSPWLEKVPSLVQAWYGGSEAGNALADVLFGDVNPSGKLPCTFPKAIKDSPTHLGGARTFPGENGVVHYDEGLFVGYRWYDAKKIEPLFPFGFGLSYTTFAYSKLRVSPASESGNDAGKPRVVVECDVANTGSRAGAEVVEFYVRDEQASVVRPEKELKAFSKVALAPGETKTVTVTLNARSFAYYSREQKAWIAEAGKYQILAGASSRDIRSSALYDLPQTVMVK